MCKHGQWHSYVTGIYCPDCGGFFNRSTPEYRSERMLSDLWMVLHNINVDRSRNGVEEDQAIAAMKEKIGIGIYHANYEQLISESLSLLAMYGADDTSAWVVIRAMR